MSQITIVDGRELKRFARFLMEVVEEISSRKRGSAQKLDELKQVWRDDKFREFEPKYNAAAHELDKFAKATLAYAQYLEEKAARVDRFLSR